MAGETNDGTVARFVAQLSGRAGSTQMQKKRKLGYDGKENGVQNRGM